MGLYNIVISLFYNLDFLFSQTGHWHFLTFLTAEKCREMSRNVDDKSGGTFGCQRCQNMSQTVLKCPQKSKRVLKTSKIVQRYKKCPKKVQKRPKNVEICRKMSKYDSRSKTFILLIICINFALCMHINEVYMKCRYL